MRVAVIAMLIGAALIAACDDDEDNNLVGFPVLTLSGSFVLRSVNGDPLPTTVANAATAGARFVVRSGVIYIFPTGTFRRTSVFELAGTDSTLGITCNGKWTAVSTNMVFAETDTLPHCGEVFRGVRRGDELATTLLGLPALYSH
jgi:hypothetical protein